MATTKIALQEESVLKLVLEFLTARKYYKSARSLEKETGVTTNPFSENVNFLRDLVLDGDWPAVREFGEPFADIPAFEYRRFNFLVARQEYLEILFEKCEGNIKDEQVLRDRLLNCLQNLERYCKHKDEYNKLYWYLSVPSLRTEPEFCNWSVDSSRMLLFEEMLQLLKQFIPTGEQNLCKNNLGSEDRLLSLLFKGSLYENCIEFCQKQAMGKTGDNSLTNVKVDLFRKQSLKSTGNFYSWLHSLSKESFVVPFEELNFDVQVEKRKQTRVNFDVKNNSLSQSLTIELNSPSKVFVQRGRDERRKRFSDFPQSKQTVLDFDMKDVSQSFAEFEFAENRSDQIPMSGGLNSNQTVLNDQEVFLRNGESVSGYVSTKKTAESPRKVRRDQQDLVLQQLEEHKQRQQELYEQLAESASLARGGSQIIVTKPSVIPEESESLEAVKKSIQSLKLLTESFESDVFRQDKNQKLSVGEKFHPNTISISSEMLTRKSSSSTPGSATHPKTPVNTCLPPGLVKLTDGSGAFNTSTPKAERQSFTTPLPASPVTSEQTFSRNDFPLRQSQQVNDVQEANVRPDVGGQMPKTGTSYGRQFAVRRSLVNTVFQNENENDLENLPAPALKDVRTNAKREAETKDSKFQDGTTLTNRIRTMDTHSPRKSNANLHPAMITEEKLGSDPKRTDFQTRNVPKDSRFQAISKTDNKIDKHFPAAEETDSKNFRSQNYSTPKYLQSAVDNRSSRPIATDLKDPRLQDISGLKNTRNAINSQPIASTLNLAKAKGTAQSTNSASLNFQKSAMLVDSQAIRAVVFHPGGRYFAIGTNSKALKLCRMSNIHDEYPRFERNEQDVPELEVVCQKTSIHKGSVYCVAFSPNGDIIATGSNDKTIKLSRFDEDNPVSLEDGMELPIHNATVRDLTFVNTAAGSHPVLASGGAGGGLIHLSDCFTGQTVSSLKGHAGNVMAVFASSQAHLLCSGSADKTVRMWDLRMSKCIEIIASSSCVTSVCFNYGTAHSLLMASADDNGQCILYDVGARKSISSFNPHEMDCRSIRFSPDSKHILTGSYDACVAITAVQYNSTEMLSDSRIVARHGDKVIQCRWHPSEYRFVSSSADRSVVLWEPTAR